MTQNGDNNLSTIDQRASAGSARATTGQTGNGNRAQIDQFANANSNVQQRGDREQLGVGSQLEHLPEAHGPVPAAHAVGGERRRQVARGQIEGRAHGRGVGQSEIVQSHARILLRSGDEREAT